MLKPGGNPLGTFCQFRLDYKHDLKGRNATCEKLKKQEKYSAFSLVANALTNFFPPILWWVILKYIWNTNHSFVITFFPFPNLIVLKILSEVFLNVSGFFIESILI